MLADVLFSVTLLSLSNSHKSSFSPAYTTETDLIRVMDDFFIDKSKDSFSDLILLDLSEV